jgi:hypothetical protein
LSGAFEFCTCVGDRLAEIDVETVQTTFFIDKKNSVQWKNTIFSMAGDKETESIFFFNSNPHFFQAVSGQICGHL